MTRISIDGCAVEVAEGVMVLEAARRAGVWIPALCERGADKEALTSCMVCLVRVNGAGRMVPACATRVAEGMQVESQTEEVLRARRTALELILSDHVGPCVAPCQTICPAHVVIDRMLVQVAAGDWAGAARTLREENPLAATLGRICPGMCEKGCRRKLHDAAVSIRELERAVAERDLASGSPWRPEVARASGKRVAIVGAGPAGLSAAYFLARAGHACMVFDRHEEAGGSLLTRNDAGRLPREVVRAEVGRIAELGVVFEMGREVGLGELEGKYDAVLVTGLGAVMAELKADKVTARTATLGVFAAGAALAGGCKEAVHAVGDGHFAAQAIGAFLAGGEVLRRKTEWSCHGATPSGEEMAERVARVGGGERVECSGEVDEWAEGQAGRCLRCGCARQDDCRLREVCGALEVSAVAYRGARRAEAAVLRGKLADGRVVELDHGKCIACGRCVAITAERGARYGLTWEGRGFEVRVGPALGVDLAAALEGSAEACVGACPTAGLRWGAGGVRGQCGA